MLKKSMEIKEKSTGNPSHILIWKNKYCFSTYISKAINGFN